MRRSIFILATLAGAGALGTTLARGAAPEAATAPAEPQYVPLPKGAVTFNKQIAPILYENCASCHRPGEVAPFSFLSYGDAKKRAWQISEVTRSRFMPPWKAQPGYGPELHDARLLSAQQIGLLHQWAQEGAPEGDGPAPPPPQFTAGWTLGEPDLVLEPTEDYQLAAEGADVYRCFVLPTNYDEDRYITTMEVRPGNRAVVHHAIAYLDTTGKARQLDARQPGPGYTAGGGVGFDAAGGLGGWAPGNQPRPLPDGVGILLPKGADIVLQTHYHKTGKPETDRTKIGLYFCKKPVDKRLRVAPIINFLLRIPPGEENYNVHAGLPVQGNVTVLRVMPHMHLLGREMTIDAVLPGGERKPLLRVPDWDFNWQMNYDYKEPVKLPTGARLSMNARYDNSTGNAVNPNNPPRVVTWGEGTHDEMCIAFMFYTVDSESLLQGKVAKGFPDTYGAGGTVFAQFKEMLDRNGDGKVDDEERLAAATLWQEFQAARREGKTQ